MIFLVKDKKVVSFVNGFQKIIDDSKRTLNKIWVDKGSKLYNNFFKKWLVDNDIKIYSTHNEGKSEIFIKTLKIKIFKYMTAISKNVDLDEIDAIVKEYDNKYHTSIKLKAVDFKDNTYINFKKEVNNKDPKFKVSDYVGISKFKNIFTKGYTPNWSEEIFMINQN